MSEATIALFDGAVVLVGLITRLLQRPLHRDNPLPLLFLVRPQKQAGIIKALRDDCFMSPEPRRVPAAYVDGRQPDVRALLSALCIQLGLDRFGLPRIKFRHFPLIVWLMDQDLGDGVADQQTELVRKLRSRPGTPGLDVVEAAGAGADSEAVAEAVAEAAAEAVGHALPAGLTTALKKLVGLVLFRARISGRIPWIGREYRWCMRQPYVVPRLSASFPGFAVRLTRGHRSGEKADQVDKLLVHAFLQDLRIAYRRRPWRPPDWRRTAYPVGLLDHVHGVNSGYVLLQLINQVRNETGQLDPLLVVGAGEVAPNGAVPGIMPLAPAAEAGSESWKQTLPAARRRQARWGWMLAIEVPPPGGGLLRLPPIRPVPAPWWASWILAGILGATVLLSGCAAGYYYRYEHCGAVGPGGRVDVQLAEDGECIGFSDDARYTFRSQSSVGEAALMERLQTEIFQLNREADERHGEPGNAGLPLVTLIYQAQLTIPEVNTAIAADEREELEGIAIRQNRLLNQEGPQRAPLLKVIVANAGSNMHYAPEVADMLRPLIASDPSIVGVLGFDESRVETVQAIMKLDSLGLPMIAPTLSADGFDQNSDLYFQLVPANLREAEMMAQYLTGRGLRRAMILYTESSGDLYTSTLRQDLAGGLAGGTATGVLRGHGIAADAVTDWTANGNSGVAQVCGYTGAVIYTGRAEDFDRFLHQMGENCGDNRPVGPIIGDDSVSRFMASRQERAVSPAYPLVYASKSALTSCSLSQADAQAHPIWTAFIADISSGPWSACDSAGVSSRGLGPMGPDVALAYDATDAYVRAVESLRTVPVSRGAVWEKLGALQPFDGISGLVDLGSRVQDNHWLGLLEVKSVNEPLDAANDPGQVVFHCGWADSTARLHSSAACTA